MGRTDVAQDGREVRSGTPARQIRTIEHMAVLSLGRREVGLYTVADASRLAHIPPKTVSSWMSLEARSGLLAFDDLMSLRVVRRLRDAGVDLETIKHAERNLARLWGVVKPFAVGRFRTGYGAIFTELAKGQRPVAVGGAFQETHWSLIEKDLQDVSYDAEDRATVWHPSRFIVLDPEIQFGQPCIAGTRVTTRTVYQFVAGGEPFEELAEDLEVEVTKLRVAFDFEEGLWKRAS